MENPFFKKSASPSKGFDAGEFFQRMIGRVARGSDGASEENWRRFFKRREEFATRVSDWMMLIRERRVPDNAITKYGSPEKFIEGLQKKVAELFPDASPEQRKALENVWIDWTADTLEAREHIQQMFEYRDEDVNVAVELFRIQAGNDPVGKVTFINKGPFLYFTFEREDDYDSFKKGATGNAMKKQEGGCFSQFVLWEGKSIPTLMQIGLEFNQSIADHEVQHFINHRLGKIFEDWEPGANAHLDDDERVVRRAEREVKDEILAYLGDGSHPDRIHETLTGSPLYTHLYATLDEEHTAWVKAQIKTIADELLLHPWVQYKGSVNLETRRKLVASLLDIPFRSIAKYVKRSLPYAVPAPSQSKSIKTGVAGSLMSRFVQDLRAPIAAGVFFAAAGMGLGLRGSSERSEDPAAAASQIQPTVHHVDRTRIIPRNEPENRKISTRNGGRPHRHHGGGRHRSSHH